MAMITKLFEVRDHGTCMPVMATHLIINEQGEMGKAEEFLLRRAGYDKEQILSSDLSALTPYIILCKLDGVKANYDPYSWNTGTRTLPAAHNYIIDNWRSLNSGDVIDIEFILGETKTKKLSERLTHGYND